MKIRVKILICTLSVATMMSIGAIVTAQNLNYGSAKNGVLERLMEINESFEKRGEKVPEDVTKKLAAEIEYSKQMNSNMEKSEKEVADLQQKRASAPKDAAGNAILIDENAPNDKRTPPRTTIGVFTDRRYYDGLFGTAIEQSQYTFSSTVYAPYSIIIAGYMSNDKDMGVIYEIKSNPEDVMDTQRNVYTFPAKGNITLKTFDTLTNVITFEYGDGKKGCFDILQSSATFED